MFISTSEKLPGDKPPLKVSGPPVHMWRVHQKRASASFDFMWRLGAGCNCLQEIFLLGLSEAQGASVQCQTTV